MCCNDAYERVHSKLLQEYCFFSKHITIRPSELAKSPELIRRFGVIVMNIALECDLYGNKNSSHICGLKLMNGIGGSCNYECNGSISIFYIPSVAKDGKISAIVPMCSHVDSTGHDVDVIVIEQDIADLCGKKPLKRAEEIINNDGLLVKHDATGLSPIIVSIGDCKIRYQVVERLKASCYSFGAAIHPSAIVSPLVEIGEDTVIMLGAIINAYAKIGKHCVINIGAQVDHECVIGDFVDICSGTTLCGNVSLGYGTNSMCRFDCGERSKHWMLDNGWCWFARKT